MKPIIFAILLAFTTIVCASPTPNPASNGPSSPSSFVAWTTETRALLANAKPEAGAALVKAYDCASCHGEGGIAPTPNWPSLAGQLQTYLYKQLKDYQDGKRQNAMMQLFAKAMNDEGMAAIAAYYASLPLPEADRRPHGNQAATRLAKIGDGNRLISACQNCHGRNGQGNQTTNINLATMPALVGQFPAYLEKTLQDYKTGARANDVYSRMRHIAAALSDEEIAALAAYYGTLAD